MAEFTAKAIFLGVLFGLIFGASTVYLGLRAGLTVSASIPIAVLAISVLKKLGRLDHPREQHRPDHRLGRRVGGRRRRLHHSRAHLPAAGRPGVLQLHQITLLAFAGGILGVLMMVPLRRALIVKEHGVLPYPEGTACAEVLVAGERGGKLAGLVFSGLGIGALWKSLSWIFNLFRHRGRLLVRAHQPVPQRHAERRHLAGVHGRRLRHRPAHRRHDGRRRRAVVAGAAAAAVACSARPFPTPFPPIHPNFANNPATGQPFLISEMAPGPDLERLHPLHRRRRGAGGGPDHAGPHAADHHLVGARRPEGLRRRRRRRDSSAPNATCPMIVRARRLAAAGHLPGRDARACRRRATSSSPSSSSSSASSSPPCRRASPASSARRRTRSRA